MKYRSMCILSLSLMGIFPTGAAAQQPPAGAEARAKVEFDAALVHLQKSEYEPARLRLKESLALHKSAGALLNIAYCEQQLELLAGALQHYREALEVLPATDVRRAVAEERIKAIEPRVPTLRIRPDKEAPPGMTVLLDGKELSSSAVDTSIPLDPGAHTISVRVPGQSAGSYEPSLAPGEKKSIVLPPAGGARALPAVQPTTATSPVPLSRPNLLWMASAAMLGVGGVALLTGAVTGGMAVSRRQELGAACPGSLPRSCDPGLEPLQVEGAQLADLSTAMFGVAGVALAGGVATLVLATRAKPGAPRVGLFVGPATMSVQGSF